MMAWRLPVDERSDEQIAMARRVNDMMMGLDAGLDDKIAIQASPDNVLAAKRLASEIRLVQREIQTIDKDSATINYNFWKARTGAESEEMAVLARQALYDAEEMRRRSIYDDEFDRDYKTKEVTITKRGAISLYLDAYDKWKEVLASYPELESGGLAGELVDSMKEFEEMLTITNRQWPREFPLQAMIDRRAEAAEPDELPTTEQLEEMWSATEEERQMALEAARTKAQRPVPELPSEPIAPEGMLDEAGGVKNQDKQPEKEKQTEKSTPNKADAKSEQDKAASKDTKKDDATESKKDEQSNEKKKESSEDQSDN